MTVKELADLLHNAGLNAFEHPQGRSGDDWNSYRERIAAYLISEMQHKVWDASREQKDEIKLFVSTPIKGDY
jgi:hypothetical protein